jgi:MarR family transcriptional regulator for hemolysin
VESSTLVPILDKMEKHGFVLRKSDPTDRRNNKMFLTPKSRESIPEIVNCILNVRKIITMGVSERDLDVARKVLKTMTKNANDYAEKKGKRVAVSLLKTT